MKEWKFPHGQDLTPTGHNNTAIEMFLDNIVDSLTREVLQNSLDAYNENSQEPVLVTFEQNMILTNDIPGIDTIKSSLKEAKKMWSELENEDTLGYLNDFESTIKNNEIPLLKISDYNTTGLNEKSYNSLVVGNGYSQKNSESSAGSKGIGKAAPFAASKLRMVFYNTLSTDEDEKAAGIMNFVSFYKNKEENIITQERATFADNQKNYINNQFTFNYPERGSNEYGTDLFIIGLKEFEWDNKILLSTVNNFLLSIYYNKLKVKVAGVELSSNTLSSILDRLSELKLTGKEKNEFENTLRYYDTLTNENSLLFNLDERFDKYDFIDNPEDGKLIILQHEPANRAVLQTRKAGMKIYERKSINGHINFTGIFQALGSKFNAFLKEMENANHDKWSPDRLDKVTKRIAENLLKDLLQWYKAVVTENFEKGSSEEIEAFGVKDLLPIQDNEESQNKNKDSGIRNKIKGFKIKEKANKNLINDGEKEGEAIDKIADEIDNGPGNSSGSGSDRTGEGGGDNPDQNHAGGDEEGEKGGTGEKIRGRREVLIGPSKHIKLKILEVDSDKGEYNVRVVPFKNIKNIKIILKYVGADGKNYDLKINKDSNFNENVEITSQGIQIKNVKKNQPFSVKFITQYKVRMKMEAYVYEVKN